MLFVNDRDVNILFIFTRRVTWFSSDFNIHMIGVQSDTFGVQNDT